MEKVGTSVPQVKLLPSQFLRETRITGREDLDSTLKVIAHLSTLSFIEASRRAL